VLAFAGMTDKPDSLASRTVIRSCARRVFDGHEIRDESPPNKFEGATQPTCPTNHLNAVHEDVHCARNDFSRESPPTLHLTFQVFDVD